MNAYDKLMVLAQSQGGSGGNDDAVNKINEASDNLASMISGTIAGICLVVLVIIVIGGFFSRQGLGATLQKLAAPIVLLVIGLAAGSIVSIASGINLF